MTTKKSPSSSDRVRNILSNMTLADKIGQMSQIELSVLLVKDPDTGKVAVSQEKLKHYFGKLGVGSLFNSVGSERWEAHAYREVLLQIQDIAQDYGRPPVIWGLDSVHGANYVNRAILTPQQLGLAASFNTTVAYQAGKLASRDTRAAGVNWLFSPVLGLALEPRWSRMYETLGEDPKLVSAMGAALISGIQVPDDKGTSVPSRAAACAKHFVGYSKPQDGHDRSPSWIPTRHLYQYFVPPWRAAVKEAMTVMESFVGYDGVPNVANGESLGYLLREQLGFKGVLVTDDHEILNLYSWHHIVVSEADATMYALREGTIDMSMIPYDPDSFRIAVQSGINSGFLSMGRIDRSVERILALKEELGMMDEELERNDLNLQKIGSQIDRADALDMAHQAVVLVENHGQALPLNPSQSLKIHLTGPTSNSLRYQSGGWTYQWQGVADNDWFDYGTTVLDAINTTSDSWLVSYSCGIDILGMACDDPLRGTGSPSVLDEVADLFGFGNNQPILSIGNAVAYAAQSDYVVVCVGEENYAEKPGDIRSLTLPDGQVELVRALAKEDVTMILVYFGGRPRLLDEMAEHADAVVVGFLPGPDAGTALVDIISGKVNPSGRLPLTYPKYEDGGGAPYYHAVSDECTRGTGTLPHWEYVPCEVQWPFGHGLSYTTFEYSELSLNTYVLKYASPGSGRKRRLKGDADTLFISVNVKNTGSVDGSEAVLFFTFDEHRHVTPEYKRLRAFEKVFLGPGEEQVVTATLSLSDPDLLSIGAHDDTHLVVEDGLQFRVGVGAHADCRQASDTGLCSGSVTIDAGDDYNDACDAACLAWEQSPCASAYGLSRGTCYDMCRSNTTKANALNGWGWNYVNCVEQVSYDISQTMATGVDGEGQCWKMTGLCRDIFVGGTAPAVVTTTHLPVPAIAVALVSGLITTVLILFAMRGGLSRFDSQSHATGDHGDVQFSVVDGTID